MTNRGLIQERPSLVVPTVGTMVDIIGSFDEAYEAILDANGTLASARDIARAHMQVGKNHNLRQHGSYSREAFMYAQFGHMLPHPVLVRESPLLDLIRARDATEAHRRGNEYHLDDATVRIYEEQLEADSSKPLAERRVLFIPSGDRYFIPTNRFGDEEVPQFLFGDQAAQYGQFLHSNGTKEMPWGSMLSWIAKEPRPLVRQMWFGGIGREGVGRGYQPGPNGDFKQMHEAHSVRGLVIDTSKAQSS